MKLVFELLSHRGISTALSFLLAVVAVFVPGVSLFAVWLFAVISYVRTDFAFELFVAILLPYVMYGYLFSSWQAGLDFISLSCAIRVYSFSGTWLRFLQNLSYLAFMVSIFAYVRHPDALNFLNKEGLTLSRDILFGFLSFQQVLAISLISFLYSKSVRLIFSDNSFLQGLIDFYYVVSVFVIALVFYFAGHIGLLASLALPFLYFGHVQAVHYIHSYILAFLSEPLRIILYYLALFLAIFTNGLVMVVVFAYMALGLYKSISINFLEN